MINENIKYDEKPEKVLSLGNVNEVKKYTYEEYQSLWQIKGITKEQYTLMTNMEINKIITENSKV